MASTAEERMAIAAEASDTTATEVEGAPQTSHARMLKTAGAAGAAVLAASALVAAASRTAQLPILQAPSTGELQSSYASSYFTTTFKSGTGCKNWNKMLLRQVTAASESACAQTCAEFAGCNAMNFQSKSNAKCNVNGDHFPGACYLYSGTCDEETNECWTLGNVSRACSPDPITYKEQVGCSNWDKIFFDLSIQPTRMECARRCHATAACVGINFQGLENSGCTNGEGAGRNACYLSNDTCVEEPNTCWALGYMCTSGATTTGFDQSTTV